MGQIDRKIAASDATAYITGATYFIDGGLMRNTDGLQGVRNVTSKG